MYTYMYVCVCMYVCMYVCVCMYVRMYVCMYALHACMYIYVYALLGSIIVGNVIPYSNKSQRPGTEIPQLQRTLLRS